MHEPDLTWDLHSFHIPSPSEIKQIDCFICITAPFHKHHVASDHQPCPALPCFAMNCDHVLYVMGQVHKGIEAEVEDHFRLGWIVVHHGEVANRN